MAYIYVFFFLLKNMSQSQNMTTAPNSECCAGDVLFLFLFFFFSYWRRRTRESVFASLAAVSATLRVIRAV